MWCRDFRRGRALTRAARLALVLAAAGLSAGCWQPLYGSHPGGEGVQDKFAAVDIPPVSAPKGTPTERVAVGLHNALQFDLHNGGSPAPTVYVLKVSVAARSTQLTSTPPPAAPILRSRSSSPPASGFQDRSGA
jgi:LPS-assembly lipoprotein